MHSVPVQICAYPSPILSPHVHFFHSFLPLSSFFLIHHPSFLHLHDLPFFGTYFCRGVILYAMVTGQLPFLGKTTSQSLRNKCKPVKCPNHLSSSKWRTIGTYNKTFYTVYNINYVCQYEKKEKPHNIQRFSYYLQLTNNTIIFIHNLITLPMISDLEVAIYSLFFHLDAFIAESRLYSRMNKKQPLERMSMQVSLALLKQC